MADPIHGQPNKPPQRIPQPGDYENLSLATRTIHADDPINYNIDVAPPLHVSTTYRYNHDPTKLDPSRELELGDLHPPGGPMLGDAHIYSRLTAPNTSRLELMLTSIIGHPCLTYSSGLSAFHALLVWLKPRVIAIGEGYHGCHGVLGIYQKLTQCKIVNLFDEISWDEAGLGKGDVVHLETPVNPTGLAFDIEKFAAAAKKRGAYLTVDATFAPPPLLDPFQWGADFVMHSGTKYFGGHSDMLCGVVAIGRQQGRERENWEKHYWGMYSERVFLGSVMGSLEGWLGVRSLRTLELRVLRQSANAEKLVRWLNGVVEGVEEQTTEKTTGEKSDDEKRTKAVQKVISKVLHASLQSPSDMNSWLKKQMPHGFGPVFSIRTKHELLARHLPSKLKLFHHATSLGGVESLIEWRKMSDAKVEGTLLRVSVGVENWEDLKEDFLRGCGELVGDGELWA
ncbi:hypothetical protein BST61_g7705 [Cercospora zeina]